MKNINVLSNLIENEEILYVAEKDKVGFYGYSIILIAVLLLTLVFIFKFLIPLLDLTLVIIFATINIAYIVVLCVLFFNYFSYELFITNKKLILKKMNTLEFIEYDKIISISNSVYGIRSTSKIRTDFNLYRIMFIKHDNLMSNLIKIYPSSQYWKEPQNEIIFKTRILGAIFTIFVLIIIRILLHI